MNELKNLLDNLEPILYNNTCSIESSSKFEQ